VTEVDQPIEHDDGEATEHANECAEREEDGAFVPVARSCPSTSALRSCIEKSRHDE